MKALTILATICVLCRVEIFTQQIKQLNDCDRSVCSVSKSAESIFQVRNTTIRTQRIVCQIKMNITGDKCVVDIPEVLSTIITQKDVMLYFAAKCITPAHITFNNSQNVTKKNVISYLHLQGHCSFSPEDVTQWGRATDFRVFYIMENAVMLEDKAWQMRNRTFPELKNIGTLTFFKANPKKFPSTFTKYIWPRMAEVSFSYLKLTSIPAELKITMPLLQSLEVSNNNLIKPPDFPWCGESLNLPRELSRSPTFNDHYEVGTTISSNIYRRFLDLSFNNIEDLSTYEFRGFLNKLNLKANGLKMIKPKCFRGLKRVQAIDLSNNKLTDLPLELFHGLDELLELRLQFNDFSRIPEKLFQSQKLIKRIDLNHNKLSSIPKGLFSKLNNVEVLHLEGNVITNIDNEAFAIDSSSLREIYLQNNKINRVPKSLLLQRQSKIIDLSLNRLTFKSLDKTLEELDMSTFVYQHRESASSPQFRLQESFIHLSFARNNFTTIDLEGTTQLKRKMFEMILRVYEIDMTGNPLLCDGKMLGVARWLRNWMQNDTGARIVRPQQFSSWKCAAPIELKDKPILSVDEDQFKSPKNLTNCPEECSCFVRSFDGTVIVDCKERNLVAIPRKIPRGQTELFLNRNNIKEIPSYPYLENVTALYLSHNKIKGLDEKTLARLQRIKILFIDSNKFTFLPKDIQNISFVKIALHHNFFRCDCSTKWMKNWLRRNEAYLVSIENVLCHSDKVQGKPMYSLPDEDFVCTEEKENSVSSNTQLAFKITAFSLGGFLIVFLVASAVGYKFRGEVKVFMYTHLNWHPFDRIDDSDPNKIYDAFISYSGSDYQWVSNTLRVRLENHDPPYKLCLHHRDFLVGAPIQQNILNGIDQSKRMIMVLSSHFVKSEWCLLEFRAAHQKVLEDRMNYLIIILFDDVDMAEVDDEIKLYMRTNTYLSIRNKWFWEKLFYALPHNSNKKVKATDCQHSTSENSGLQYSTEMVFKNEAYGIEET